MVRNGLNFEKRRYVIGGIACLLVSILIGQLFYLQIVRDDYKDSANGNAFFNKTIYPARGTMLDRNGKLLVFNQPTYDIVYVPREVTPFDTTDFCSILGLTRAQVEKRFVDIKDRHLNPGYSRYTLQTFLTQLRPREYALFQEKLYKFPGFDIQNRTLRQYNYPNAGLILGYVAEVNKQKLEADSYYSGGDYAGKSGIESSYEKYLRGEKGVEVLLRDAHGRIQGHYENGKHDRSAVSGKNLTLSIDIDLQAYGERLMKNKIGSIVMIEPATGQILCMVSSPSYDPSLLLGRDLGRSYSNLYSAPNNPLFNRSIQGRYPPGSTFKTTQGLICLQEGIITPRTSYTCHGGWPMGGGHPGCHIHPSPLTLEPAISTSCNSYFSYCLYNLLSNKKYASVGAALDVWKDYLVKMGFGYRLGVDLPSENTGFIPNSKFYNKIFKSDNWIPQNIISNAIGQGEILETPLQLANLAATIANKGYYYAPHIVKVVQDRELDSIYTHRHYTGIDSVYYGSIVRGMAGAVTGAGGAGATCRAINMAPDIIVCGKTGTSENSHGKDHSIFMGFAPEYNASVAISVIVENGGFGATYAVPIARLMMEKYLKGEIPVGDKPLEERMENAVILPAWKAPVVKK